MTEHGKRCCTPQRAPAPDGLKDGPKPLTPRHVGSTAPDSVKTRGMVLIPGGFFLMGAEDGPHPEDGEGPVREVSVAPFYIDVTAVTNRQFQKFVQATGYKTEAETFRWSFVFHSLVPEITARKVKQKVHGQHWWWRVPGACWKRPEGRETNLKDRMDHPVVHVSWNDAAAYCAWAGKRLPTEAEHECATRGGLVQQPYPWGDELTPGGEHRCNVWQGNFPAENTLDDGYLGTAPARSFPPNGYGLYNMTGNVWEWAHDWFDAGHAAGTRLENPEGPAAGQARVIRGGSYLCHHSYCQRYRTSSRTANTPDSATGNMGFRCVVDARPK